MESMAHLASSYFIAILPQEGLREAKNITVQAISPMLASAAVMARFVRTRTCNFFLSCKKLQATTHCPRFSISICFKWIHQRLDWPAVCVNLNTKRDDPCEVVYGRKHRRDAICISSPGSVGKAPSKVFRNTPGASFAKERGVSTALSRASS